MGITRHGHTERLDLADPTLREWECTVVGVDPDRGIVLDRSAFYPGGGGQPPDHGVLLWSGVQTRIVGTRKGDDLYLLPVEGSGHTLPRLLQLPMIFQMPASASARVVQ